MNEMQRIIDELRFLLQRDVLERSDDLVALVEQYSGFCHEINGRLRQCDHYLRQGLRSEALHLAEAAPNLLDAVAVLDFAELPELNELLSLYFIPGPQPLLLDVAAALNAAYGELKPVEKLLDLHRLLAIGRAPLSHRVVVVRELAATDPGTLHWEDDQRAFEKARLREIQTEFPAVLKTADEVSLKSMVSELQAPGWKEPIPANLLRDLKTRFNQIIKGHARQRMSGVADHLHDAFSALDADAARASREEWRELQSVCELAAADPLMEQVSPILQWLDDEDRKLAAEQSYQRLVAEVERALDSDSQSVQRWRELRRSVERCERKLPESLETRFRSRVSTAELLDSRRRKMIIGTVVTTVALIVGVIGFLIQLSFESARTRKLIAATNTLIDEGKLADAQAVIDQHGRSTAEPWLGVKRRLADAEKAEEERVGQWKSELATAQESPETSLVEAALKRARELTRTASEKAAVAKSEAGWQKRLRELTSNREKSFRDALTMATQVLQDIDARLSADPARADHLRTLLSDAEQKVALLAPLQPLVARELKSQAALVESRLKATQKTLAQMTRKSEIQQRITQAVMLEPGSPQFVSSDGRFEAALKELTAEFPNDPQTPALTAAIAACPLPSTRARQTLIDAWKRESPAKYLPPADKPKAEKRLKELRTFFTSFPQSPDREVMSEYEAWLASILRRYAVDGDPDEGMQQRLYNLLSSKFIKEGYIIQDVENHTYYLEKAQTTPFGSVAKVVYQVGFNGETHQISLKPEKLVTPLSIKPPQQEIASKVRSEIKSVKIEEWRPYFQELIETILKSEKMDPFLRYLLVLKSVEFAGQGDSLLEQELAPVFIDLNDDEIDRSVAWMDPNSKSADSARSRARELLAKVPAIKPLFEAAAKRQAHLEQSVFAVRFSIGWLEKNSDETWICHTNWKAPGEFRLLVATHSEGTAGWKWSDIGRMNAERLTVDSSVARLAGPGAVVYAQRVSDSVVETNTVDSTRRNVPNPFE